MSDALNPMAAIDPNALYTAGELRRVLGRTLWERVRSRSHCVRRDVYFGRSILESLETVANESRKNILDINPAPCDRQPRKTRNYARAQNSEMRIDRNRRNC